MTMIEGYKTRIIDKEGSGVESMLRDWKVEDLRLVFDVLSLSSGALKPCIELVRTYATNQGLALVKDNKDLEEKPLDMVHETINLKEKYDDLLEKAFSTNEKGTITKDKEFANAVKKAFDDVVNTNARFHEYLSLYVDSKLKTGKTQILENEFDVLFDKVISLFRHMKDKDVFEKYYKTHLAKRLLGQRSQSDEAEKSFISKLKTEFGYQFTSKLEGMFTDMKVSKDSMDKFKSYQSDTGKKTTSRYFSSCFNNRILACNSRNKMYHTRKH